MSKIILDFGSGNTCRNDITIAELMINELKTVDTGKHEVIIKWQLFEKAGDNIPLDRILFRWAYLHARELGYKTTASIFDRSSLDFLFSFGFDIPFIKIANRRDLDWLIGEIPRKIPVYVSTGDGNIENEFLSDPTSLSGRVTKDQFLFCISEYPATVEAYEKRFPSWMLPAGISDHTTDFALYKKYRPRIIEWHYKLDDSIGLDAGPFARTPAQLAEVL